MSIVRFVSALSILGFLAQTLPAQEVVKESSTGKTFPVQITVTHEGKTYPLTLTGTTVRKKLIVKVYGMGHYMQDPPRGSEKDVVAAVLTDGKAKQLTMEFVRDVDVEKIQGAYRDGFTENATAEELKAITPLVDQFLGYFTTAVKENDRYILRWLPGGTILATVAGVDKPAIKNPTFARVLWSIWLGEDSIVDREELVERQLAQ
jgi:hypothetical protein